MKSKYIRYIEELVEMLIGSMKRNLKSHKEQEKTLGFNFSSWQAEKIKALTSMISKNKKDLNSFKNPIDDAIRTELNEQYSESTDDDSVPNFLSVNKDKLDNLIKEVEENTHKAMTSAFRTVNDVYRQTVIKAGCFYNAGGISLDQAVDLATKDFLKKGINSIEYSNGRRVNIDDYCYMVMRTANKRAKLYSDGERRQQLGIDTVYLSQYSACSDTCLPWQGKVYIDDVYQDFKGPIKGSFGYSNRGQWHLLLSQAIKNGVFHPNCRHFLYDWIDGISTLPPEIDKATSERNYKLEQKQRWYERNIRKYKRLAAGTLEPSKAQEYKNKARELSAELDRYITENELKHNKGREKVQAGISETELKLNNQQFLKYYTRLGTDSPQTLEEFNRIKLANGDEWIGLQLKYRYKGIDDRLLARVPSYKVMKLEEGVPESFKVQANNLSPKAKKSFYRYTDGGVNCAAINKYTAKGELTDEILTAKEDAKNIYTALNTMSLPQDTVVFRGTKIEYLTGLQDLINKYGIYGLKSKRITSNALASCSLFRDTAYDSEVAMTVLIPNGKNGVGYIESISQNPKEYEALLQKSSEYYIIESQKFNNKIFLVVEWLGGI